MSLLTLWPTYQDDDGTFTFGSVVNAELLDDMKAAIEAVLHSATNPTISPANIIDEVETARGNLANLNARLSGVIDADGALVTPASLVTQAQAQTILDTPNVAKNSDLARWAGGGAAAPDDFTLSGAGAAVARTGSGEADTFSFGTGQYAAKVTFGSAAAKLTQIVIAGASFANYSNVKSQKFSVSCKIKTAIASHARIVVDDGATQTPSAYHTGGNTEEHISVTHTISGSATKLEVYVEVVAAGAAYFGGFTFVFSDLAPVDWNPPLALPPDAGVGVRGLVNFGAQTFEGLKTFDEPPLGIELFSRSTADFTKNNNNTLADVTGLSFAIGANETWVFRFVMTGISQAAADIKFAVTFPAATTSVRYGHGNPGGSAGTPYATSTAGATIIQDCTAAEQLFTVSGIVRNGANAGTVQLQAAQAATDASDTIIRADSYVIARRIA